LASPGVPVGSTSFINTFGGPSGPILPEVGGIGEKPIYIAVAILLSTFLPGTLIYTRNKRRRALRI